MAKPQSVGVTLIPNPPLVPKLLVRSDVLLRGRIRMDCVMAALMFLFVRVPKYSPGDREWTGWLRVGSRIIDRMYATFAANGRHRSNENFFARHQLFLWQPSSGRFLDKTTHNSRLTTRAKAEVRSLKKSVRRQHRLGQRRRDSKHGLVHHLAQPKMHSHAAQQIGVNLAEPATPSQQIDHA